MKQKPPTKPMLETRVRILEIALRRITLESVDQTALSIAHTALQSNNPAGPVDFDSDDSDDYDRGKL